MAVETHVGPYVPCPNRQCGDPVPLQPKLALTYENPKCKQTFTFDNSEVMPSTPLFRDSETQRWKIANPLGDQVEDYYRQGM
jgi:hypothetical protein